MTTFTVDLPDDTAHWVRTHAQDDGKSVSTILAIAVEAYREWMTHQRREDDRVYDQLGVPPKDRAY